MKRIFEIEESRDVSAVSQDVSWVQHICFNFGAEPENHKAYAYYGDEGINHIYLIFSLRSRSE